MWLLVGFMLFSMEKKIKPFYPFRFCPLCGTRLEKKVVEGKEHLYCPKCEMVIWENPVPVVACVVLSEKNEILLVKRGVPPAEGMWALPSGYMEIGEQPEETAKRELREETGLEGEIKDIIGIYGQSSTKYRWIISIGYRLDLTGGKLRAGDDAADAKFFPIDKIPEIPFSTHRKMIEKIRSQISRE